MRLALGLQGISLGDKPSQASKNGRAKSWERHSLQVVSGELVNEATRARYIARNLPDRSVRVADPEALNEVSLEEALLDVLKLNRHGETRSAISLLTAVVARLVDQRSTDVESR